MMPNHKLSRKCVFDQYKELNLKKLFLQDMLDKNVGKLEELQQTCNAYPQRRRQRFAPNLFNGYARR